MPERTPVYTKEHSQTRGSPGYFLLTPHHWEKGRTWKHFSTFSSRSSARNFLLRTNQEVAQPRSALSGSSQARAAGAQDNIVHNLSLVETVLVCCCDLGWLSTSSCLSASFLRWDLTVCSRVASKFCAPSLCPWVLGLQFALQYTLLSIHHSLS